MKCTYNWIAAATSFFIGMIMGFVGIVLNDMAISTYFVLANWVLAGIGWVLWFVGLVNFIRKR